MQDYIQRLIHCGYSPHNAYSTCYNFIKEFSVLDLETYITSLEKEVRYVDRI
jgi:hypothetical protein